MLNIERVFYFVQYLIFMLSYQIFLYGCWLFVFSSFWTKWRIQLFLIYVIETLLDWAKELSSGHVPQNDGCFISDLILLRNLLYSLFEIFLEIGNIFNAYADADGTFENACVFFLLFGGVRKNRAFWMDD